MKTIIIAALVAALSVVARSASAQPITVCNQSNTCASITNNGTGDALDLQAISGETALSASGKIIVSVQSGYGIWAWTPDNTGVAAIHGQTTNFSNAVEGYAHNNASALYGNQSGTGFAAYLQGNVGYTGSLTHESDARLKKDIAPIIDPVAHLLQLKGVTYSWKEPEKHGFAEGVQYGFIAQDVEAAYPNWVRTNTDGMKMISTDGMLPMLVETSRVLKTRNDELETRVKALEAARRPSFLAGLVSGDGLGFLGLAVGALVFSVRRRKQ